MRAMSNNVGFLAHKVLMSYEDLNVPLDGSGYLLWEGVQYPSTIRPVPFTSLAQVQDILELVEKGYNDRDFLPWGG